MRVFVSSLIAGFLEARAAAKSAIETLRHEPVMAEDFGAQPSSPQIACLQGLRSSDLVVLILGEGYGQPQTSGLSATHEEYREAKGSKPVLAFVQEGMSPEPAQSDFIQEVQGWEGGFFRVSFSDPENLRTLITQALHDYELTTARTPIDAEELRSRAVEMLPDGSRSSHSGRLLLSVAIVAGPRQQIIRASSIEDPKLADRLQQAAQFGTTRLLDASLGTERSVMNDALVLQQDSGASFAIHEEGSMQFQVPLGRTDRGSRFDSMGASVIIEEDVQSALRTCLEFTNSVLEDLDKTQRLSHLGLAVTIAGGDYRGWRTRAEHDASPSSIEIPMFGSNERSPITLDFPRPALRLNRNATVEDVIVRLRRQWRKRS
ncbi:DUF4062 domain-containing protein [Allosphingosinicella sp.]|uniref:DUF4062 domain-containing protein n=1 Tax=Allosphingosinicella sp. TaxID=2823234 RepID=UPI0037836F07